MICPKCKAEIKEGMLFCTECGGKISYLADNNVKISEEENKNSNINKIKKDNNLKIKKLSKKTKCIIFAFIIILVICLIAASLITIFTKKQRYQNFIKTYKAPEGYEWSSELDVSVDFIDGYAFYKNKTCKYQNYDFLDDDNHYFYLKSITDDSEYKIRLEDGKFSKLTDSQVNACLYIEDIDKEEIARREDETLHQNYNFSYSASSYLIEKLKSGTTSYSSDNLRTPHTVPWVPDNESGNKGIGEYVIITGKYDPHVQILFRNGYQSCSRSDLFKKNSRVKSVKVSVNDSENFIVAYLEDSPKAQIIDIRNILPTEKQNLKIKIEIESVYPGTKYSDVCIDSILPFFAVDDNSIPMNVNTSEEIEAYTVDLAEDESFVSLELLTQYDNCKMYGTEYCFYQKKSVVDFINYAAEKYTVTTKVTKNSNGIAIQLSGVLDSESNDSTVMNVLFLVYPDEKQSFIASLDFTVLGYTSSWKSEDFYGNFSNYEYAKCMAAYLSCCGVDTDF